MSRHLFLFCVLSVFLQFVLTQVHGVIMSNNQLVITQILALAGKPCAFSSLAFQTRHLLCVSSSMFWPCQWYCLPWLQVPYRLQGTDSHSCHICELFQKLWFVALLHILIWSLCCTLLYYVVVKTDWCRGSNIQLHLVPDGTGLQRALIHPDALRILQEASFDT